MTHTAIGLAVTQTVLRVVGVKRGKVVWMEATTRTRDGVLSADVVRLLATRPPIIGRGTPVVATIGPAEAQLRPVPGLPNVAASADRETILSQNADRFFMNTGSPLRVSAPSNGAQDEPWASAVESLVISEVAKACSTAGLRLRCVAPFAVALLYLPIDAESAVEPIVWIEDGVRMSLDRKDGLPVRIRRERDTSPDTSGLVSGAVLPDGVDPRCAVAYAATHLRARDPLVIGEHAREVTDRRMRTMRTRIAAIILAASVFVAMFAPPAIAAARAERTRATLGTMRAQQRTLLKAQRDLGRVTSVLNAVNSFDASRRSMTLLLGQLALALPESTAITTLRVDTLGGAMTVISPRAAGMLDAVATLPGVSRALLAGAVTREATNGVVLEHASVRFVIPHVVRPDSTPPGAARTVAREK